MRKFGIYMVEIGKEVEIFYVCGGGGGEFGE